MNRLEKCELLKSKGYTYDPKTGKIYGVYGKEITAIDKQGYIALPNNLRGHHFAWYMTYGNVDFERLDHEDQTPSNNRIDNLRILTHQENLFNSNAKGYSWSKKKNKWISQIRINYKGVYLGSFNTEQEARQAYIKAKEKYHLITK